jgi:Membrane protein involved in colicin uptake
MTLAVFDCKNCGYTQPVDAVHIGTVFSCPTCSAVVMVTAVEPSAPEPAAEPVQYAETQQAVMQAQQAAHEAAYLAQQAAHEAAYLAQQQSQAQNHQQAQQYAQQAAQEAAYLAQQQSQTQDQQAQQYAQQAAQEAAYLAQQQSQTQDQQAQQYAQQAAPQPQYTQQQYEQAYMAAQQEAQQPAMEYADDYASTTWTAEQDSAVQDPAPARQAGFDPAMVAYQTGAVSSPIGVPVASSQAGGAEVAPQPYEGQPKGHSRNVPVPDLRRTSSLFSNVLIFAVMYIFFMAPYLIPYLKSLNIMDISLFESGSVMSPFTLKLVCSVCLVIIALFRGLATNNTWLFVFPVVAGALTFIPALPLPSFLAPALHVVTLALGVLLSPRPTRRLIF